MSIVSFQNYLTAAEAAELIGCSDARVRQMIRSGEIAAEKLSPRMWIIAKKEATRVRDLPYKTGRPRKNKDSALVGVLHQKAT